MLQHPRSLKRSLALGLAACAIAPAAAGAMPVIEGQGVGAGGGPGLKAEDFSQSITPAPDQIDRTTSTATSPAPTWPTGPQPAATRHAPVTAAPAKATPSDDGGLDTGIWLAIGGGALVAAGGIGLAGRKRLVVRKRQLA
ncbi:MAG: hypothetical protein V7607_6812 [Solirubrobacteraceae bacterium]